MSSKFQYSPGQTKKSAVSTSILGTVQQANLSYLDNKLRNHWSLGKNILLCWSLHEKGLQILVVPHYYLNHFTNNVQDDDTGRLGALNDRFIRQLISDSRYLSNSDFISTAKRFSLQPVLVPLPLAISIDNQLIRKEIDTLIKRYSINYVTDRAVLLFDIVDFSLATPFEQTSLLNSLSYSLNSAYKKLLDKNIEINFSRSNTGDGYYVWSADLSPQANANLFQFMLLVIADNAVARKRARGQFVPSIRTGFHIGSHFEFFQVDGLKPGMDSYIVGDVTIELARMLDKANPGQIMIGDMRTSVPTSSREGAYLVDVDSQGFVERVGRRFDSLVGVPLADEEIEFIYCYLSGETGSCAGQSVRRYKIIDKHGLSRHVYNLRVNIRTTGLTSLTLGIAHSSQLIPDNLNSERKNQVRLQQRDNQSTSISSFNRYR